MDIDKAIDNLWIITDDTFKYKVTTGMPSKLIKSGDILLSKRTKVQGYISYFLPKDKKGKLIGKPQRMLVIQKLGSSTTDLIPANNIAPYYDYVLKNKNYYLGTGQSDLVAQAQNKVSGEVLASKFSGATGNGYDVLNAEKIDTGSLLNAPLKRTFKIGASSYLNANGDDKDALAKLSDPNVSLVDADTMKKAYQQSGTKRTFKDWLNSENTRNVIDGLIQLANIFVNKPQQGVSFGEVPEQKQDEEKPKEIKETKILGMSPVTFGIVAFSVIAIGAFVGYKIIKGKN